jgi:MoxR-like ATPase
MTTTDDAWADAAIDAAHSAAAAADRVIDVCSRVVLGSRNAAVHAMIALATGGHILLDDVPGTGKTTFAKVLADALGLDTGRLQCTPDLLPGDITGVPVWNPKDGSFSFRAGPVFTHVLLVDEINRATPKAQSALLEAMAERQVSVDGETRQLSNPFLVIATQNPVESVGTYPLPEAQLDRFALCTSLGYPSHEDAVRMVLQHREPWVPSGRVISDDDIEALIAATSAVHVSEQLASYIASIVEATRAHAQVFRGASPRAAVLLARCASAHAVLGGRAYANADDVKAVMVPCLAHRLELMPGGRRAGITPAVVIGEVANRISILP